MIEPARRRSPLLDEAGAFPQVLDAAIGTRLMARGLRIDRDDPALWNLTHPEVVAEIHALDLDAGADAVLTNTFGGNRVWLARYGMAARVSEINRRAIALARQANGPARFVIGAIGPTAVEAPDALREQVDALLADDGVDALLFETYRLDQAESTLASLGDVAGLPLIVSLARWPEPVEDAARTLEDLGASVIGGNCQVGTAAALEMAGRLAPATRLPLWVKPAAGLPGGVLESPASFASAVPAFLTRGVRFLGGCCGTTEAHVAALRAACYDRRIG